MQPTLRALFVLTCTLGAIAACSDRGNTLSKDAGSETVDHRPNFLLVVADDLGYADIGAFGGEIHTPNLDRLTEQGVILNNFYTGPTCSVSRSMLMSGMDSHLAGLGNMAETVADNQMGLPGYEGHLVDRVATIAEVLGSAGYHTYMAGKWHLGVQPEHSPFNRGFEKSFAMLYGGGSHFADMAGPDAHRSRLLYRENGRLVQELPSEFYSTTFFTDRIIEQIDSDLDDGKPFFAYLAYTAPHWPLQVPDGLMDKYRGKYDGGYDKIREDRFDRQVESGLFHRETAAPSRPEQLTSWNELSDADKRTHARNMEIYAAMVEFMDFSIGRVLEHLDEEDELRNTVVVFLSDNGADPWDYDRAPPAVGEYAAAFDNSLENVGRKGSFTFYGAEWAHVSNTPFSRFKGSTYNGGVRSPAIVSWPAKFPKGLVSRGLSYIADWFPTFIELASADGPQSSGRSLVPLLLGDVDNVRGEYETIGVEVWGRRSLIGKRFKLVGSPDIPHQHTNWELYDTVRDPSEQIDLAADLPDELNRLQNEWSDYESTNNVILPKGDFRIRPPAQSPTL